VLVLGSLGYTQQPQQPRAERTREFLGLGKPPDPVAAARGAKLYERNCAFCHGAKATGAEGPDLVRSSLVLHDEDGEQLGPFLKVGRPDRGMPAFASLTPEQTKDIAAFLHERVHVAANRGTYQVLNIVTGDAKAGEAYFNGAGKCATCHSVTGDLAHIGSRYSPADLQLAFLYPGAIANPAQGSTKQRARRATITLPSGQVIHGTLQRMDDFDVAILDDNGGYRSWPRTSGVKVDIEDPLAEHRRLLSQYSDADMHNLLSYLVTLK
jgi:mono/diheme cytochrome c family protein